MSYHIRRMPWVAQRFFFRHPYLLSLQLFLVAHTEVKVPHVIEDNAIMDLAIELPHGIGKVLQVANC